MKQTIVIWRSALPELKSQNKPKCKCKWKSYADMGNCGCVYKPLEYSEVILLSSDEEDQ